MGGQGSGRWRFRRRCISECESLTVAALRTELPLELNAATFRLTWDNGAVMRVDLVVIAQAFGGVRWRIRCPQCGNRRVALYIPRTCNRA